MADVQPLRALRYNLGKAGGLDRLTAPPYDVIDADKRAELASRSPYNVVHVDLPENGEERYDRAGALLDAWRASSVLEQEEEPTVWAMTQTYRLADGRERVRHGFFCRVRITDYGPGLIRPHERTHPAAKEDRLRLMRATKANLSPIFALYPDSGGEAWSTLESATRAEPWAEVIDDEQTSHRVWRVSDREAIARVHRVLSESELLIADGHHRYETARTYAEEIGGEGDHRYVLMCLVSMSDPGLAVLPTHRLVRGIDAAGRDRLARLLERSFETKAVTLEELAPEDLGNGRVPSYGFLDGETERALRLELSSPQAVDGLLAGHAQSYRRLDTAVLEKLVLEEALGMTEDDISEQRGLGYARDVDEALAALRSGAYQMAFLLRATPVEQVQAVAEAGETMPPKSTYFYPKLLTGLLFNPLR
jgi:uncharacterized protein (DUF1015 family)